MPVGTLPLNSSPAASPDWRAAPERGSPALLRLMTVIALRLGWRVGHALLFPITAYFLLTAPRPRHASREFLRRALGREAGWRDLWHLYFSFSSTILDRVWLCTGRTEEFRLEMRGLDELRERMAQGRGVLLMGAHLGSFEAMRAVADAGCPVELAVLMHEGNAARVKQWADALGGEARAAAIIPLGQPDAMLRVRECLERGGLVGLLADRAPEGARMVSFPFLGAPAAFPAGPHQLAAVLGVPVMLAFGLRRGPRHYEVRFEPFEDLAAPVARAGREDFLHRSLGRYAARLEDTAREAPDNWFNFHRFWGA
ncbi:LpxL/LpxP family acyltransferase [Sabulicella rubraurantiaca]|uniref:LpxL/LpxP family acyltransferase n=1 Tax=Sabulicella rubraurantiaca TaxID=2811429 RepID=UPI001A9669DE|nr:hypothetical protein [Sabulicella rubraurantiaca]